MGAPVRKKTWFLKELRAMMFGFGDDERPYQDTVEVMEDLVFDFVVEMTEKCVEVQGKKGRLSEKDLQWVIRKDRKKYARVKELMYMSEELKKARKAFDEDAP